LTIAVITIDHSVNTNYEGRGDSWQNVRMKPTKSAIN